MRKLEVVLREFATKVPITTVILGMSGLTVAMVVLMIVYLITSIISHSNVKKKCEDIEEEIKNDCHGRIDRFHCLP